jgi:hypothetical protein
VIEHEHHRYRLKMTSRGWPDPQQVSLWLRILATGLA